MSILVNNYPIFEDNQVLNSDQLNQLIKYLDQQERLTRSCLIGMGIACGLELDIVQGNKPAVVIHEGLGVSSEGFLIKLCPESTACVTVQYRDYKLPEGTVYTPFQDNKLNQDVTLFELLTDKFESDADETIEPLTSQFLSDKVVVLFLECLDKDLKSCLGKSCDELGIDRIFTLRKLLISRDDLDKVNLRSNGGRQDDLFLEKFKLKDISLPRVLLKEINTVHYLPFAYKYVEAINFIYHPLRELLELSYKTYEPILNNVYGGNPFEGPVIKNAFEMFDKYLSGGLVEPTWLGVQYVYDFFKDLILAYQEFKECAYDLMIQCCPDMSRFPRHLMLGRTFNVENERCEIDKYRHSFTQPSIYNHQKYLLAKTLSLHKRIVLMLEKFSFERLQHAQKTEKKLTPSCEKKSLLSHRSIPFYYDSKSESEFSELNSLEFEWNYERTYKQCQVQEEKSEALNLSYDNNTMNGTIISPLTTPLHFDIDQLNFLRIEGFQQKQLKEALPTLMEVKNGANLDFDVQVTYFGQQLNESQRPDCLFSELQPDYEIWRNKFLYMLVGIGKLVDISRFAVSDESKITGLTNQKTESNTESKSVYSGVLNNLKTKVTSDNWSMATDEILFKTSSLNMREWTQGKSGAFRSNSRSSGRSEISELFVELRQCLIDLRKEMPEDFRYFQFEKWLEKYKCPLKIAVEAFKLASEQFDRSQITIQLNTYFSLFCQLHSLLRNLAIHPYIEIGILKNNIKAKIDDYNRSYEFTNFMTENPGLVHKAGTEQGQTFVLLCQADYTEEYLKEMIPRAQKYLEENKVDPSVIEQLGKIEIEFGAVLGDFNIPHLCCDPCSSIETKVAELNPIATPIVETVPISQFDADGDGELDSFTYGLVKEILLHEVYEIERYHVRFTGQAPKFGTATIEYSPSDLNEEVLVPYLQYKADVVAVIAAGTDAGYLIDEFGYEIEHAKTGEILDSSSITILVPNIESDVQVGKVGVRGRVITFDDNEEVPIVGAKIQFDKFPDLSATSTGTGDFSITTVSTVLPNDTYNVTVVANQFIPKTTLITIKNDIPFITVQLVPFTVGIPIFTDFLVATGEDVNSEKSLAIIKELQTADLENKKIMKSLIEKDGDRQSELIKAEKTISLLTTDSTLSPKEISAIFTKNRDALLIEIGKSKGEAKKLKTKGLATLTTSFMDRLALTEPKQLSAISKKTLNETGKLFKENKINVKTSVNKWTSAKEKVLGAKNVNRLNTNLKL